MQIEDSIRCAIEVSFLLSYEGENLSWLKHVHKNRPLGGTLGYLDHEGEFNDLMVGEEENLS